MERLVIFYRDSSRLFLTVERLSLFLQTLYLSWKLLLGQNTKFDVDSNVTVDCRRFDKQILFFIHGDLENIIQDIEPREVVVQVGGVMRKDGGVTTDRFVRLIRNAFEIEFSLFFDGYSGWIKASESNCHNWLPIWNFARVVRNAISHGGAVNINSPGAPRVAWRGVEYDHTKLGRRVEEDISIGDLVFLMMEMDAELDSLEAPHHPYVT